MARETYDEVAGADVFVTFSNDVSAPAQMPKEAKIKTVGYGIMGLTGPINDTISRLDGDCKDAKRRIKRPDSMY